ncbi:MAG: carbohydrate ABC transporter permease [Clostridia bacterium]|nr:carbohydrate ABC transporter permease [Clostridia bacterium]
MKMSSRTKALTYVVCILGVLLVVFPLYVTVVTAFKSPNESARSFLTLPSSLYLDNFQNILRGGDYWTAFFNTVYITAFVLLGNLVIMPMLAYAVSRSMNISRWYRILYYYLLLGIFIPFQVKMIPLVKLMSSLNLMSPTGLSILCIGSSTCESVFLYVGYMESIPRDIEEAAYIDGASTAYTFYRVVLPLLKPILATAMIKDGLWIWNDYMLPLLILNKSASHWTLTLFAYNFRSTNAIDYGASFACYCLQMLPILVFYVFMQKNIIGGLTAGAVKS